MLCSSDGFDEYSMYYEYENNLFFDDYESQNDFGDIKSIKSSEDLNNAHLDTKNSTLSKKKRQRDNSDISNDILENENENNNEKENEYEKENDDSSNINQRKIFDINFQSNMIKKRGRKSLNNKDNGKHNKLSEDNIIEKIKTYIFNHIIVFLNLLIKEENKKLIKLDSYIVKQLKTEFNQQLINATLKKIFLITDISDRYKRINKYSLDVNRNIINKIYENNENNENEQIIRILNLTFGEVFDIFISDLKPLDTAILDKIKGSKILDCKYFSRAYDFLEKVRKTEMKNNKNKENVEEYINKIKDLCITFKQWFENKIGRNSKNAMKYSYL